ncbi:MAG: rhodanese-like domain-containing protein [Syntrophaceae bacterium]|nr:rhodanese-like domain-containing protein [Syntrophaceae bacterium]
MKTKLSFLILIFLMTGLLTTFAFSADVPMITKDQLKAMLGSTDLVILDVRIGSDYFASDLKIKGAVRPNMGENICGTTSKYPRGSTFVFYCASPNEERSVMNLKHLTEVHRADGYTKVYVLKGGWEEWLKAGYPTEKK